MSRRRRGIYLVLLGVGAAAFTADRWIFSGGPAATGPAKALGQGATQPAVYHPVKPDAQRGMPIPEMPFPQHLPPPDEQEPIRDLFAPPARTLAGDARNPRGDKEGADKSESGKAKPTGSDTFAAQHRLNGVLIDERLRIAIVDGVWLHVGESLAECTLVNVFGNEARFKCFDGEAVLKVVIGQGPGGT